MPSVYGNISANVSGNVGTKLDSQTANTLSGIEKALNKIATHLEGIQGELQRLNKPKVKGSRHSINEEETPEKKTKLKTGKEIEEMFYKLVDTKIFEQAQPELYFKTR